MPEKLLYLVESGISIAYSPVPGTVIGTMEATVSKDGSHYRGAAAPFGLIDFSAGTGTVTVQMVVIVADVDMLCEVEIIHTGGEWVGSDQGPQNLGQSRTYTFSNIDWTDVEYSEDVRLTVGFNFTTTAHSATVEYRYGGTDPWLSSPWTRELDISVDGTGGTTDPPPGTYEYITANKEILIKAIPDDITKKFAKWVINYVDVFDRETTVILSEDTTAVAFFDNADEFDAVITKEEGEGIITPAVGTHRYYEQEIVTITAEADIEGYNAKIVVDSATEFDNAVYYGTAEFPMPGENITVKVYFIEPLVHLERQESDNLYDTDFSPYTIGAVPTGWEVGWRSDVTWEVIDDAGTKKLRHVTESNGRSLLAYVDKGVLQDSDNIEVFAKGDPRGGSGEIIELRIHADKDAAVTEETTYRTTFYPATDQQNRLRISRYLNGAHTVLAEVGGLFGKDVRNEIWCFRFRRIGSKLQLKMWLDGEGEPLDWNLEVTDTQITSGYPGVGKFNLGTTDFLEFQVNTNVDESWFPIAQVLSTLGEYFDSLNLQDGITYSYRAQTVEDNKKSEWSNIANVVYVAVADNNAYISAPIATAISQSNIPIISTTQIISTLIVSPVAVSNTQGNIPGIISQIIVSIQAISATSTSDATTPTITALIVINATVIPPPTEADTEGIVPSITTIRNININSPITVANSQSNIPTINATKLVSILPPISQSSIEAVIPNISSIVNISILTPIGITNAEAFALDVSATHQVSIISATAQSSSDAGNVQLYVEGVVHATIASPTALCSVEAVSPNITSTKNVSITTPSAVSNTQADVPSVSTESKVSITSSQALSEADTVVPQINTTKLVSIVTVSGNSNSTATEPQITTVKLVSLNIPQGIVTIEAISPIITTQQNPTVTTLPATEVEMASAIIHWSVTLPEGGGE